MKRLIIKIFCLFIKDKNKQIKLKRKYDKFYKIKYEQDLKILKIGRSTGVYPNIYTYAVSYDRGIESGVISNKEDHEKNIEQLKSNLEKESLDWLNNFFRIQNLFKDGWRTPVRTDQVFNKLEETEYNMALSFQGQVIKKNGYYQWDKYKLPENLFDTHVFLYKQGFDKLETFDKMFSKNGNKVIIDVGAYLLDTALILRDMTDAPIYAFEPTRETYELGLKTIELNNLSGVIYENIALGEAKGECKLCAKDGDPLSNCLELSSSSQRFSDEEKTSYNVNIESLDDYVKNKNIEVGLIKTDIEGFEPAFLKGAINTIKTQKPIMAISIYHDYYDFYKIKTWIEDLDLGYKFKFYKGLDNVQGEIMLLCEVR